MIKHFVSIKNAARYLFPPRPGETVDPDADLINILALAAHEFFETIPNDSSPNRDFWTIRSIQRAIIDGLTQARLCESDDLSTGDRICLALTQLQLSLEMSWYGFVLNRGD